MTEPKDPFAALQAQGWTIDDRPARCRSCHAEVMWCTSPAGKRAPYDLDGVSHFATCPQAKYWRGDR